MFRRNALITIALAAVVLLSSAPYVQADEYVTTLDLRTPVRNRDGIDTMVYRWSTNKTSGIVRRSDLLNHSMELWSGNELIYTDTMLICGEPQPIGGVERPAGDIRWRFDLTANTLILKVNVSYATLSTAAGTQYLVSDGIIPPSESVELIVRYTDGGYDWGVFERLSRQSTVVVGYSPVAYNRGPYLGAVDSPIVFDGTDSSDPDSDPLAYDWDFGDNVSGIGPTPDHTYGVVGIYDVCLTVTDSACLSDTDCTMVVVYDPSAGFVTGGGWIYSEPGAYVPDPALEGKATFGFVSKYKKGATVPTGNTEFQFKTGSLNFHSSSYDWLVVTGANVAKFKGIGTVNGGSEAHKFQVWAGDSPDTFRIKIWVEDEDGVEVVVYDNGLTNPKYENGQPLDGGSIVIHKK